MDILIGIIVLSAMGLLFGLVLAIASRAFYVHTDPRLEQLNEALPGANCGGCGFTGCSAYAKAVLCHKAEIGRCTSGGDETAQAMGAIMGVKADKVQKKVALVRCGGYKGTDAEGNATGAKMKGYYEGIHDCMAAAKVGGHGPLICKFGCLGFGNCTKVCQYDAIHLVNGVAKVDPEKCTGCMSCAAACPRNLIVPVSYGNYAIIACASKAKGAVTIRGCSSGCIGCGLCQKICPEGAIHVQENLASIDYEKCTACGLCATVCPKHLIASSVSNPEKAFQIINDKNIPQ